jgi:hypothetical protein
MLSIFCFLQPLAAFMGSPLEWKGIVGSDSQSLPDTLHLRPEKDISTVPETRPTLKQIKLFSFDPLLPERDANRGIQVVAQEMSGLRQQYVAGHQDWQTPIHKLSLLAQLNVEADALATKYQTEHGSHELKVLLTDWAGVHLNLPSGTITSNFEASIQFQATGPPLQAYVVIIWHIWSQWYLVWEMPNHDLHGADASSKAKANREEVERSFREVYDVRAQIEPSMQ